MDPGFRYDYKLLNITRTKPTEKNNQDIYIHVLKIKLLQNKGTD